MALTDRQWIKRLRRALATNSQRLQGNLHPEDRATIEESTRKIEAELRRMGEQV